MREILFRGKQHNTGEWIEGGFARDREQSPNIVQFRPNADGVRLIDIIQVIPETIGQYTGLTDKNGKKIFEGDILKGSWNARLIVYYDKCYLQFGVKEISTTMNKEIDYYGLDKIEVIGNIHDNPELLKGGEADGNL